MKLILKENIIGLGYKDDVVEVKDGYGRNYLIPQHKAVIASNAALKQLEEDKKQRAHKIAKEIEDAQAKAQALEGVRLSFPVKTSANGTLYGSVNAADIADELGRLGHEIDRKIIVVAPVKTLGVHTASVKLHKEVSVDIEFDVIAKQED